MSLQIKPIATGKLNGAVYTFEAKGDILPMHKHTPLDVHISIIARGSFRVHGPDIGDRVYSAGAVIDFEPGFEHEFIAAEDNSRLVNIIKGSLQPNSGYGEPPTAPKGMGL
jgi:quercetin dioxygenase-like cupin family protein